MTRVCLLEQLNVRMYRMPCFGTGKSGKSALHFQNAKPFFTSCFGKLLYTTRTMKRCSSETKGQGTPSVPEGASRKRSRPARSTKPNKRTVDDAVAATGSKEATAAATATPAAKAAATAAAAAQPAAHTADDLPRFASDNTAG